MQEARRHTPETQAPSLSPAQVIVEAAQMVAGRIAEVRRIETLRELVLQPCLRNSLPFSYLCNSALSIFEPTCIACDPPSLMRERACHGLSCDITAHVAACSLPASPFNSISLPPAGPLPQKPGGSVEYGGSRGWAKDGPSLSPGMASVNLTIKPVQARLHDLAIAGLQPSLPRRLLAPMRASFRSALTPQLP